jgi:hypothetical protein
MQYARNPHKKNENSYAIKLPGPIIFPDRLRTPRCGHQDVYDKIEAK